MELSSGTQITFHYLNSVGVEEVPQTGRIINVGQKIYYEVIEFA